MRIAVFCEARRDFETATTLVDRALCSRADWIADLFPEHPEGARTWVEDGSGRSFFDLHRCLEDATARGIRTRRGRFGAVRALPGSVMARHAFLLAAAEHKREPIDAVVLVWDADGDPKDRREGLDQAREEAVVMPFAIVLGLADRMREAWILAGFDPETDRERMALAAETKTIGFAPNQEPHRLQEANEGGTRNAKRALAALTANDPDRESRCLTEPALETLRARGEGAGLRAFLDDIETRLVPLANPSPRSS